MISLFEGHPGKAFQEDDDKLAKFSRLCYCFTGRGRKNTLYRKRAIHLYISKLLVFPVIGALVPWSQNSGRVVTDYCKLKWNGILKSILKDLHFTVQKDAEVLNF